VGEREEGGKGDTEKVRERGIERGNKAGREGGFINLRQK